MEAMAMLSKKTLLVLAGACLAAPALYASEGCDPGIVQQYHDSARVADSLRPDKPGVMRVYAADGSEFTAGQALWMQGQLRLVDKACARGDQAEATRRLAAVRELLKAHQRKP
jgi:hypothetical protein